MLIVGRDRHPQLPEVPTLPEAGLPSLGYELWFGMFAPPGTPVKRLRWLGREIRTIVHSQGFTDKFVTPSGYTPVGDSP